MSKKLARVKSGTRKGTGAILPAVQDAGELERHRQESFAMKAKIRGLEQEVDVLKQRLDSLRKAKSTTIIKREREEIRIQSPHLGRPATGVMFLPLCSTDTSSASQSTITGHTSKELELQEELSRCQVSLKSTKQEVDRLTLSLANSETLYYDKIKEMEEKYSNIVQELEQSKRDRELQEEINNVTKVTVQCTATAEIDALTEQVERFKQDKASLESQLDELVAINTQLRVSNEMLEGKCESLLEDLSIKEAQWTEKEEKLHAEIRKQWGERYHQWIAKAEKKMEELQQVNQLLQSLVRTKMHNPDVS